MTEKVQKMPYLVKEQGSSALPGRSTETHLWFQVLEGEDEGMRVSIPLYDEDYSEQVEDILFKLKDGDIVEAELLRESKDKAWKPSKIELVNY